MVRIGIIGLGSIGRRHLDCLIRLGVSPGDLCVHDPREEAQDAALKHHVLFTTDRGFFYGLNPDVVIVATPAPQHIDDLTGCIEAGVGGRGFFVEKPFALSVQEALPLAANISQPTMVACNWRFHPDVLDFLKEYVPVADSGEVRMLHAWCTGDMESWPGMHYECAGWEGIHELDLALSMGDVTGLLPVRVVAASATHETFELVATVVGGPFISIDLNFHQQKVSRGLVAVCAGGGALRSEWSYKPSALDSMYYNQMKHFLGCVEDGKETCHSFLQSIRAVRVTEQALSMTGVGP